MMKNFLHLFLDKLVLKKDKSIKLKRPRGFTLIELMIVVAVIGILASIAMPKFADLIRKSKEASTKGNLATMRSALAIYYADNDGLFPTPGNYPTRLNSLLPKYMESIPYVNLGEYHNTTNAVGIFWNDMGKWQYISANGYVRIDCDQHTDTKGVTISRW